MRVVCNTKTILKLQRKIRECGDLGIEVPEEILDVLDVFIFGAIKHAPNNWLEPNGNKSSHKDMHASTFRHAAESSCGNTKDVDTELHPALHGSARNLMVYTRWKRNIKHEDD